MTALELKLALAKELPELIAVQYADVLYWKDTFNFVTDREWDWVVRECEKKLTRPQMDVYLVRLDDLASCYTTNADALCFATWQQRAEAYFKVKGII